MASLSDSAGAGGNGGGGRAGAELMVPQFLLKALHAILAVRSPRPHAPPTPAAFRRRDRWFHLPLHAPPPPPSAEHLPEPSPGEPLVVDVYLAPSGGGGPEEVLERWTVACEPWPSPAAAAAVGEGLAVNRAYKRCITLLRSLYAALRFLPAYRAFRTLCASGQVYNYEMGQRVGSFAMPFSRAEEAAMRTKRLAPVETQLGRLVVSVQYLPSLDAFNFEVTSLASAAIITDYVGSPAAERMRAFPASLTEAAGPPFPQPSRRPNSWASPAPWPHTLGQQAKFSPPPAHYASPTPSPPTFGYLHSRFSGETAPMSTPQAGGGRGPIGPSRGRMASAWEISIQTCRLVLRLRTVGMNLACSLVCSLLVVHHDLVSQEVQADYPFRMVLMMPIFLLLWMMLIQIHDQGVVVERTRGIRLARHPFSLCPFESVFQEACL